MLRHCLRIGAVVCSVSLVLGYIAYASLYSRTLPLKQTISGSEDALQTDAPDNQANSNAAIPAEIRAIVPSTKSAPIDLRPQPDAPDPSNLPRVSPVTSEPNANQTSGVANPNTVIPSTKSIIIGGGSQFTPSYTPQTNSIRPNSVSHSDPFAPSSIPAPPPVRK